MPAYLALDVASVTGFAHGIAGLDRPLEYGSQKFDAADLGERAAQFVDWLLPTVARLEITDLAIEPPVPVMGATRIEVTIWLQGIYLRVLEIAARRRLVLWPVHESTWRSWFLGVTRAPKEVKGKDRRKWLKQRCIAECRARGFNPKDDNSADALAILDYVKAQSDPDYAAKSKIQLWKVAA